MREARKNEVCWFNNSLEERIIFVAAPLLESSPGREREREEGSVNGEGQDDEAER